MSIIIYQTQNWCENWKICSIYRLSPPIAPVKSPSSSLPQFRSSTAASWLLPPTLCCCCEGNCCCKRGGVIVLAGRDVDVLCVGCGVLNGKGKMYIKIVRYINSYQSIRAEDSESYRALCEFDLHVCHWKNRFIEHTNNQSTLFVTIPVERWVDHVSHVTVKMRINDLLGKKIMVSTNIRLIAITEITRSVRWRRFC